MSGGGVCGSALHGPKDCPDCTQEGSPEARSVVTPIQSSRTEPYLLLFLPHLQLTSSIDILNLSKVIHEGWRQLLSNSY